VVSKGAGLAGARIQIVQADGVPAASSDKYEVVDRRARVCIVAPALEGFVGGSHLIPLSQRNAVRRFTNPAATTMNTALLPLPCASPDRTKSSCETDARAPPQGKDAWIFSKKEEGGNPFVLRAQVGAGYELYIELSALCRKKGSTTTGQLAVQRGDIKELACGHATVPLDASFAALKGKVHSLSMPAFLALPFLSLQLVVIKRKLVAGAPQAVGRHTLGQARDPAGRPRRKARRRAVRPPREAARVGDGG
jgi:hypothetical protein